MTDEHFERELQIFRKETDEAAQCFHAYLAVHKKAGRTRVRDFLNRTPLFWKTCLAALQTASFIALARIFDEDSPHNLNSIIRLAQNNVGIFSKESHARRKRKDVKPPQSFSEFLQDVYEPTSADFKHIRALIKEPRKIYQTKYADLRHGWFAHEGLSEREAALLFADTDIREFQGLLAFLGSMSEAFWQLFFNGTKPSVQRYSPGAGSRVGTLITIEAERFLMSAAKVRQRRRAKSK
jgi:hypothetical protein